MPLSSADTLLLMLLLPDADAITLIFAAILLMLRYLDRLMIYAFTLFADVARRCFASCAFSP